MSTKTIIEAIGGKPTLPLGSLGDGSTFEFVGLEGKYKNLRVSRATSGGTYIRGFRRDNNGGWVTLPDNYQVSNGSAVRLVSHDEEIAETPEPQTITKDENMQENNEAVPEAPKEKAAKTDYVFPDGEFTLKAFAEANGINPIKAKAAVEAAVEAGTVRNLGTRPTGQRGKPPTWFAKA